MRKSLVGFVYTDCELIDSEDRLLGIGRSVPWDGAWTGHHLGRPLFSYRLHAGNNSGIGARLLPELDGRPGSERLLGRVWPAATLGGEST